MKKIFAVMLALCMVFSMSAVAMAADLPFTDVKEGAWYAEDVAYVYDNGIMVGVGNDLFAPANNVTRAMVWTTLARIDGSNTADSTPWWQKAQEWVVEKGISDGLRPEAEITREELVTMMYRYADYAGMDVSDKADLSKYTDADEIATWADAQEAMEWACAVELVIGVGNDSLAPKKYATRAELAAILHRYMETILHEHEYTTEAGYHKCTLCSLNEMCTPKVTDGDAVVCAICGADYVVAAEATFEVTDTTIKNEDGPGLESLGTLTAKKVTMDAGTPTDYAVIARGGNATLEDFDLDSKGGGIGAVDGAKVTFVSGEVAVNTASTSGRYNFYAEGEGTEITIKDGKFSFSKTLNQKRAYIYAGAGTTVRVEGGTFGPASKRSGYTGGIMGDGTVIITGGTFGFDPTKWVAEGYEAVKDGDVWNVVATSGSSLKAPLLGTSVKNEAPVIINDPEIPDEAQIGDTGYDTLQDALTAAADGDIVTLIANLELDKSDTVKTSGGHTVLAAVEGKSITLDMNGKTIIVDHMSESNSFNTSKDIYSVIFVGDGAELRVIGNGSINVNAHGTRGVAYMFWKRGTTGSLVIEDGYYHADQLEDSMIYTNGNEIVTVNGGTYIIDTAGERANGCPWMFNGQSSNANAVLVNGGSYNIDITDTKYQYYQGEMIIADGMIVQERDKMYHVIYPRIFIGEGDEAVYFDTMNDAIAAAQDGDIIVLEQNIDVDETAATDLGIAKLNSDIPTDEHVTLFNVSGKTVTVDLNGRKIYADVTGLPEGVSLAGIFSTRENGHLILKDSVGTGEVEVNAVDNSVEPVDDKTDVDKTKYANVYAMIINLEEGSTITIESGTYILDRSVSAMIDTRSNEGVIVKGGTFKLANVFDPGLKNGQAWTFNAKGQNTRHVIVTGGTFPADIQHQYYPFEVSIAKELALQYDSATGMYTVVPAVAYVNEQEYSGAWYTNEIGYATLAEALAAVEPQKTKNGKVSAQEYVTPLKDFDGIVFNENGTITITEDNAEFDLGGEILTFNTTNAITVNAENVVIDGTAEGSGITVNASAGEKATIINVVEGGSCTVNGGTYTANSSGAGTVNNYAPAVYVETGATLKVDAATILAKDNGEKGFAVGIQAMGNAEISNATVIAEANYKGNAAGTNYGSASRGIYSEASLELYDCYVWGAHSGITTKGSVYVDGGTYEGFGHGGFYLAGGSKTSHFYNATINWAPMRDGFGADDVAGTNGAGMYISGASNIKAYFDSCMFNMNGENGNYEWDGDSCPLYAVAINNGNNEVYVSNSHIEYASRYAFRLLKSYSGRYVYYGVGNTVNEANVKEMITTGKESQLIETNESYAPTAE